MNIQDYILNIMNDIKEKLDFNGLSYTQDSHVPVPDYTKGKHCFFDEDDTYYIKFGFNWEVKNNTLLLNLFKPKTTIKQNEFYVDSTGMDYVVELKRKLDIWLNCFKCIQSNINRMVLNEENLDYAVQFNIINSYKYIDFPRD